MRRERAAYVFGVVGRWSRYVLVVLVLGLIAWSFIEVGVREFNRWMQEREGKMELTVLFGGEDEADEKIFHDIAEEFEKMYPEVRIKGIYTNNDGRLLKTMLAAGIPPDLIGVGSVNIPPYVDMELLLNLDPFIEADRAAGKEVWLDEFYPNVLDSFRYDGEQSGKGPLYAVPQDLSTLIMFVNLDLFERAGVEVPFDGWSWDEFEAAVTKIQSLNDELEDGEKKIWGGSLLTAWDLQMRIILWSFGGSIFGDNFYDIRLEDENSQAALEMVRRLVFDEKVIFNSSGLGANSEELFRNGRVGVIGPLGRWKVPGWRRAEDLRWDVVPIPYSKPEYKTSGITIAAAGISAKTKHPQMAYEFLKFRTSAYGQKLNAATGHGIPSMRTIAESELFYKPGEIPVHSHIFLDAIEIGKPEIMPEEQEFGLIFASEINKALVFGEKTPLQAAKDIKSRFEDELASPLKRPGYPRMNWLLSMVICVCVILAGVITFKIIAHRRKIG